MKKRLFTLTAILVFGGFSGTRARAATAGPFRCPTDPTALSEYIAGDGADCTVGNLEFFGFTFTSSGDGAVSGLAGSIEVIADPEGLGGGFTFSDWQAADTSSTATYTLAYSYKIFGDPPVVDGASLGMDPVTGSVTIDEALCPPGVDCFELGTDSTQQPHDGCGNLPNLSGRCWIDETQLPDLSQATTTNTITITGSGPNDPAAGFDDFDNIYDVVETTPEPVSGLLALGSLVVIGLVRRYR